MRKIWVIACREYKVAVRNKAFIVTMLLMPALMGASAAIQLLFKRLGDQKESHYAVIDRSGGNLAKSLEAAAEAFNQRHAAHADSAKGGPSKIVLEIIPPSEDDPDDIALQRFEQSKRVERNELEGIIEIGPKVFEVRADEAESSDKVDDESAIRFQAKKATQQAVMNWADQAINAAIQAKRLADKNLKPHDIRMMQEHVPVKSKTLTKQTAEGNFVDATEGSQIVNLLLPATLIALMFMVVMVGATPAMHGVVEEKSQRIAEVLLGSVTPFQLMAGKLLGVIGVATTLAGIYLAGGYVVADHYGVAELLSVELLMWFVLFMVMALLIFGSLFIAIGAAASDVRDTQTLLMPIMIVACLPFVALGPIMLNPNGKIAVICSFFPFATPMILVARQSVPPGVPLWQMISGIALVLATSLFCVWSAGRIFRVGILMQGRGARFSDLIRWVVKG
jgi:ABC-2 type transport system permease protein